MADIQLNFCKGSWRRFSTNSCLFFSINFFVALKQFNIPMKWNLDFSFNEWNLDFLLLSVLAIKWMNCHFLFQIIKYQCIAIINIFMGAKFVSQRSFYVSTKKNVYKKEKIAFTDVVMILIHCTVSLVGVSVKSI